MKKAYRILSVIVLLILSVSVFVSCSQNDTVDVWQNATYTEDTEFGNGSKTLVVEVKADDKSVVFTIKTDKPSVGDALSEFNLIEGEEKSYGMYVKKANGMVADYDENRCYWSFSKNGEYMMTGVDQTEFADGDRFELVYTRE